MSPITHETDYDLLLPVQLLEPERARSPETRLMAAVLEDAIREYQRLARTMTPRRRRTFSKLTGWFDSEARDHPFAFLVICDVLDLDPSWLRTGLARWDARRRERELAQHTETGVAA